MGTRQIIDKEQPPKEKSHNHLKIKAGDLYEVKPRTKKQEEFFRAYQATNYFMALHGVAGTGKTYIAMYKALEEVLDHTNPFNKITIIRSAVQSRDMGHLPGDVEEKMDIYLQPYRQICHELFNRKDAWDRLVEQNHAEFVSTSFIRGTTFSHSIIIVDEVQNLTFEELDTIITRVGNKSKIIFCGDYRQTDLKKKDDKSGLLKFFNIANLMNEFYKIEFEIDDIVRSSLVKNYIIARTKYEDGL